MDAGVPIKRPVAGVAMGLIKDVENTGKVAVLTDIQGLEDFLGDMDFKVAGTAKGITAIQMDIKIKGIDEAILRQALAQAYDGRMHILGKMLEVLPAPRAELSKYAPKIIHFMINPEKIGEVVGPRGKTINKIIEETGVKIDIEDDGSVFIATEDADAAKRAKSDHRGHRQGARRWATCLPARSCASCPSARSSSMRPARTACSTSPSWPTSAWKRSRTW